MRFQPVDLRYVQPGHVTEEHAIERVQVAERGVGELRFGHYLGARRDIARHRAGLERI